MSVFWVRFVTSSLVVRGGGGLVVQLRQGRVARNLGERRCSWRGAAGAMSAAAGDEDAVRLAPQQQQRRWVKYYCEECKAWETREMFEVAKLGAQAASPTGSSALWSWGCSKLVRHATFQTFRVQELNNADGHDAVPQLDFPSTEAPASAAAEPIGEVNSGLQFLSPCTHSSSYFASREDQSGILSHASVTLNRTLPNQG